MVDKDFIYNILQQSKKEFLNDGVQIVGFFGSFAKNKENLTSDIDIAYILLKDIFFAKYKGFESVSKISDIKNELSSKFHRKVDFISLENSNQDLVNAIKKEIIYV